jgi:hypothetical protein
VNVDGEAISILDLFGQEWVLLSEKSWQSEECRFAQVGRDVAEVKEGEVREMIGLSNSGAVLVRPDGYIAARWEMLPKDASETVKETMVKVAHRPREL